MTVISQSQRNQFCLALGRKLLAKMSAGRQAFKKQQTEKKQSERTHTVEHTHSYTVHMSAVRNMSSYKHIF